MLRDKNLVPLSHQHQHALALCVRIERGVAAQADHAALQQWQAEIQQQFEGEIRHHFAAEEAILFPAAASFPPLQPLVERLVHEHTVLRRYVSQAAERSLGGEELLAFARMLSGHVRTEEREFFQQCQQLMTTAELERIGGATAEFFRSAGLENFDL